MIRLFSLLLVAMLGLSGCDSKNQEDGKIYLFYSDACPHCHEAMAYLDQKHQDWPVERIDVNTPKGREMIFKYARKFKLGDRLGTPLFVIGDNYVMGWSQSDARRFDRLAERYLNEQGHN